MGRVSGKIALVTGAARGQGRSHAIRLAEEGAAIIAIDICRPVSGIDYDMATFEDLKLTEKLVRQHGADVVIAKVDTRDSAAMVRTVSDAVKRLGGLDIVVANAGVAAIDHFATFRQAQWDAVIGVNLTGTWNTLRASVPHLIARGGGSIIAIASAAGIIGLPLLAPYVAAKHGVVGLTRSLSNELAERTIRVNAICPTGVADTRMSDALNNAEQLLDLSERARSSFLNAMQVDTIEKIDVSNAVLYLASDESRFVTGITMSVDAGLVNL